MTKARISFANVSREPETTWFARNPVKTLVGIGLAGGFMVALMFHHFTPISADWQCLKSSWLTGKLVETCR